MTKFRVRHLRSASNILIVTLLILAFLFSPAARPTVVYSNSAARLKISPPLSPDQVHAGDTLALDVTAGNEGDAKATNVATVGQSYPRDDEFSASSAGPSLGEAVDNLDLTWLSDGWFGETDIYFYGGDAAQSRSPQDESSTGLWTYVTGPALLIFYWKVSSEPGDRLAFSIDGHLETSIDGEVDWSPMVFNIDSGTHTLSWRYGKDCCRSSGNDCGWVDRVQFISFADEQVSRPTSPSGPGTGTVGQSLTYSTGGSTCSLGHSVQYLFSWGDGTDSGWLPVGTTSASKDWTSADSYPVLAQARCAVNTGVVSDWSYIKMVTISPVPAGPPLGEAVDNTGLTWTTGGNANWFGQTSTYYYDGDAAQTGAITDGQFTWLRTTVTGPGTLSFYWKVSSEASWDTLIYYIDGTEQLRISGSVNWQQATSAITAGTHTIEWRYSKDGSVSSGSDCGWVDKFEFTPAAQQKPDLVITNVWWSPSSPAAGDSVTFYYTEKNQGPVASTDFGNKLTIDGVDTDVSARGSLSAGQSRDRQFTYQWAATAGIHTIEVMADRAGEVAESNENNNEMSRTFTVGTVSEKADLVFTEVGFDKPEPVKGRDVVFFEANILNRGGADASDFRVEVYLDGDLYNSLTISLGSDQSMILDVGRWIATPGDHTVTWLADAAHTVDESNETNNEMSRTFTVGGAPSPDAAQITDLYAYKDAYEVGDTLLVGMIIKNIGDVDLDLRVVVNAVDSEDNAVWDTHALGEDDRVSLAPGESTSCQFAWYIPLDTEVGDYELTASLRDWDDWETIYDYRWGDKPGPRFAIYPIAGYELFVEADYMPGHRPTQSVLDYITSYYLREGIKVTFYVDEEVPYDDGVTSSEFWDYEEKYNHLGNDEVVHHWWGTDYKLTSKWKWVLFGTVDADRGFSGYANTFGYDDRGNYIYIADEQNDADVLGMEDSGVTMEELETVVLMHELGHAIGIMKRDGKGDEIYDPKPWSVMSRWSNYSCNAEPIRYSPEYWDLRNMNFYRI